MLRSFDIAPLVRHLRFEFGFRVKLVVVDDLRGLGCGGVLRSNLACVFAQRDSQDGERGRQNDGLVHAVAAERGHFVGRGGYGIGGFDRATRLLREGWNRKKQSDEQCFGCVHVPIIPKNGSETIGNFDYIWFVFNYLYAMVAFAACGGNGLTFLFVGIVGGYVFDGAFLDYFQ
jgi:hypothetical protein